MVVFRRSWIVFFVLLGACAPNKPPVIEASQNITPPTIESPDKEVTITTNETTSTTTAAAAANKTKGEKQAATAQKLVPVENIKSVSPVKNSAASKISSWVISGAMAARSKGKGWSASLNWQQKGLGSYQIRLSGPLGSGTVVITRAAGVVTLRDGPKTATSSNAETLLKQQTGISLPVNNLYYWARGIPAPGKIEEQKYDQAGHLLVLRQAGYTIEYLQYTSVGNTILPSNVKLQGNGVFIKLIIKNWRIG